MSIKPVKLFFLFILFAGTLFADVLLESKHQNIELLGMPFYEDKGGELSLQEVQEKEFSSHEMKTASFGFTSSVYWFRIPVQAKEDANLFKWWLNISYPMLDKIDLYVCDEKENLIALKRSGKLRPFKERELKDRNFLFELDPTEEQILYLRVETQSSMKIPMHIQTSEGLFLDTRHLLIFSGIYYGLFILIFVYNLISFLYKRSRKYFLYLLFISSFVMYQLSLDGIGIVYFWPEWEWMISQGGITMMGVTIFSVILFSRDFLNTKSNTPRIDKLLIFISLFMAYVALAGLFRPYGELVLIVGAVSFVLPPVLIAAGVLLHRKKFHPARFYIAGWGFFLGGSVLVAMNKLLWTDGFEFLIYEQQIGSALGMLFLSWALADLQKEREYEYLQKLSALNSLLQDKVDRSLSQIRQHDQILIEKSRLAAMGEMIEQIAHQWRQPLNTLALLNQNLYFKVQLGTMHKEDYVQTHDGVNEQLQYMSQTIDDFRNFSQPNKEKELFIIEEVIKSALNLGEGSLKYSKIKVNLFSQEKHTVFGMRHEMMQVFMNLIKNVQDAVLEKKTKDPWLKISVEEKRDEIHIVFEDNAGGIERSKIEKVFDPYFSTKGELEGSGIGLYMSKEIVEKSMLGDISVTNSELGARFEIVLPKVSLDKP